MDSESALSVSDCRDDVSRLSDDDGVSSLIGLVGLEVFEVLNGEEVTLNFLNGSVLGLNRDRGLFLLGELSCKLAFRCNGVEFLRFGYRSIADDAHSPGIKTIFIQRVTGHTQKLE